MLLLESRTSFCPVIHQLHYICKPLRTVNTGVTWFNIYNPCTLLTQCIWAYVFRLVLMTKNDYIEISGSHSRAEKMSTFWFMTSCIEELVTWTLRVLHGVWSSASSFNFQYSLVSFRSSSSCLSDIPCLPVTSIPSSHFPSIMCFTIQSLRKMFTIQSAFLTFTVCRIFLSLSTLCNTSYFSHHRVSWYSPSFSSTTFRNFPGILKCRVFSTIKSVFQM
jgi:hypothetical protein